MPGQRAAAGGWPLKWPWQHRQHSGGGGRTGRLATGQGAGSHLLIPGKPHWVRHWADNFQTCINLVLFLAVHQKSRIRRNDADMKTCLQSPRNHMYHYLPYLCFLPWVQGACHGRGGHQSAAAGQQACTGGLCRGGHRQACEAGGLGCTFIAGTFWSPNYFQMLRDSCALCPSRLDTAVPF